MNEHYRAFAVYLGKVAAGLCLEERRVKEEASKSTEAGETAEPATTAVNSPVPAAKQRKRKGGTSKT
jgi:hypothetical protein